MNKGLYNDHGEKKEMKWPISSQRVCIHIYTSKIGQLVVVPPSEVQNTENSKGQDYEAFQNEWNLRWIYSRKPQRCQENLEGRTFISSQRKMIDQSTEVEKHMLLQDLASARAREVVWRCSWAPGAAGHCFYISHQWPGA